MLYCITKDDNSNSCKWLSKNEITLFEETTYYAYVKLKNTNKISKPYKFEYKKIIYNYGNDYILK